MPNTGTYVDVFDGGIALPKDNRDIDHSYAAFSAPSVNTGSRSVLMFRVNPSGTATLEVTLNGTAVLTQTFDSEPQRSYHEIMDAGVLRSTNNVLTIAKTGGTGSLEVSDVLCFYRSA